MSYRQVLTPVNNFKLLLKLEILDKFKIVTFQKIQHKVKCNILTGYQFRRNENSHDLDSKSIEVKMLILGTPFSQHC